jgi:hypothetical protein
VDARTTIARLILVPSLITFAVTLLRLAGELSNGSPAPFRERGRTPATA